MRFTVPRLKLTTDLMPRSVLHVPTSTTACTLRGALGTRSRVTFQSPSRFAPRSKLCWLETCVTIQEFVETPGLCQHLELATPELLVRDGDAGHCVPRLIGLVLLRERSSPSDPACSGHLLGSKETTLWDHVHQKVLECGPGSPAMLQERRGSKLPTQSWIPHTSSGIALHSVGPRCTPSLSEEDA